MSNNIILDKRGALHFIHELDEKRWETIDTIIWDPPYLDSDNPLDVEQVNKRSKLRDARFRKPKIHWGETFAETRLMDPAERMEIYLIIKKMANARFVHFHSREERLPSVGRECCRHVWVKPIEITIAGNNDRNNGEYILIEGPKLKGKKKGQVLNKFIVNCPPEMKNIKGVQQIVRACAKPEKLYTEIYRHLDAKHVLDPFAGWGRSISAALTRSMKVDAVDSDLNLANQWATYQNFKTLEDHFV